MSILSLSNYEKMKYFESFLHNFYFVTALTFENQDNRKPITYKQHKIIIIYKIIIEYAMYKVSKIIENYG